MPSLLASSNAKHRGGPNDNIVPQLSWHRRFYREEGKMPWPTLKRMPLAPSGVLTVFNSLFYIQECVRFYHILYISTYIRIYRHMCLCLYMYTYIIPFDYYLERIPLAMRQTWKFVTFSVYSYVTYAYTHPFLHICIYISKCLYNLY